MATSDYPATHTHPGVLCGPEWCGPRCDCFRVPHAFYCATITSDLVPGYAASSDGQADAADQARWDRK